MQRMTLERANALTLALSEQFRAGGLSDDDAFAALLSRALAIGNESRGPMDIGRQLFSLSMQYTAACKEEIEASIQAEAEKPPPSRQH